MATRPVRFVYLTGLQQDGFSHATLSGSWDADGRYSDDWTLQPMERFVAEDGCAAYRATVMLDDADPRQVFRWGVSLDHPTATNLWGITSEGTDPESGARTRSFVMATAGEEQRYHLTHCRRLGANKRRLTDGSTGIHFSVWAPNAQAVEVVVGDPASGYIDDDGVGVRSTDGAYPMWRDDDGIWHTDATVSPDLGVFADWDHRPYMFRITNDSGRVVYRTDLYSRCQIGSGKVNPRRLSPHDPPFSGRRQDLDGTVSCSVVVDPDRVTEYFSEGTWPETCWLSTEEFWRDEFDPLRPLATRPEDLVIYELHIGGLGFGQTDAQGTPEAGSLRDAIIHLDHLVDLGVNAVELLPLSEFEGWASWGYGTSHYFAVEYSGGGRDQFKHFVRECHRRGIAVILDVVYNHYHHDAERAQWAYDSDEPEKNIYYWYEGKPSDYPQAQPPGHGGYVDNLSTGYAPRLCEEMVRQLFISSAAALVDEFHVDGFRVDQTTSLHSYAVVHATGERADLANRFGAEFLRQWTRTMKLIRPDVFLMAEDHSAWSAVTEPGDAGGLGFDATWYADFYHHLIGDGNRGPDYARLITTSGLGDDRPLAMSYFAAALAASGEHKVVYHESHDEAGNAEMSGRTLAVAVNRAPLVDETRRVAEARARVACGLSLLSSGTPMFFMGEEVGASADYRHDDFIHHRENFPASRAGAGRHLFRYYQDLIRLRRSHPALRSRLLDVVHVDDTNRVLAFHRGDGRDGLFVIASLANRPYAEGYRVSHPRLGTDSWTEVFNSDSDLYGGTNVGNGGATLQSEAGVLDAVVPAAGIVIFRRGAQVP
ncbi:MAG: alpha-amylase family glycosyl hydrolase [Actinomycetota bacterium]|nr:alpha-amylase family glycosyl hydrolase [Actinomycetota bacterium]